MQVVIKDLDGKTVDVFTEVVEIREAIVPTHVGLKMENSDIVYPVKDFVIIVENDGVGVDEQ